MIEIKPLSEISFDELFETHAKAFKDYPFQWSRDALAKTVWRRGYVPSLSFGAFDDSKLVSFTLNGVGDFNGRKSAYDTGTGTVAEYRGKGLASQIFAHSVPYLKAEGISQYILEVLEDNQKAFSVYRQQGFTVSRRFECFRVNTTDWSFTAKKPVDIELRPIDLSYEKEMAEMHDFLLSWQNNFQALRKNPADFVLIGAFQNEALVGFGIIEPATGDIAQLAVARAYRRQGIGTAIMAKLKERNQADIVKIVNVPDDQNAILQFISASGIPKIVRQFEMIKDLEGGLS
jgi:ribosomal protein S18 acetylase RimI-like enzyme